ncbi:MAG TPA: hypothetical protein VMD08_06490, partial [Candidatus Baltobacteraceae bacterium]|nr:hypothetical protein [Candidatus Baltobacteraceae bacterium]
DPAPGELLGLRPSVSSSQVFAIMRAQLRLMGAAHIGYRARQSVLRAFFKVVSSVYSTVDDAGQRAIVQDFMPEYLVDAAPIPLQTAKQLCALAEAGILTVSSGFAGLLCTADGRPVVDVMGDGLERKQIQVDQVVNAIGRSRSNPAAEQPILRAAINAGVASVHPLGGLRVDTATGLLKDRRGAPVPNAAALGPLLTGSYLGASSVYASTKFSRLLCHAWLGGDA